MTTRRYFTNNAPQQTLNASITSSSTSCVISGTFSGWPTQFPYFAELDYGTASAEIVLVTNVSGTTATITRGQGGTAAISHAAGATLDHVAVAQDLDEANAHTSASTGVHGISGAVVGTSDSQTLSNKTYANPAMTGVATGVTLTLSGNSTAANYTASGNGEVTGVFVPKAYLNEAAATSALPGTVAGTTVWLTTPTTANTPAGLFVWNGTTWIPRAQWYSGDTGWLNITINTGFAALAGNPPQCRLRNGIVYFRGGFANTGLTANASNAAVGNLPAGIPNIPSVQFFPSASATAPELSELVMNTSGAIDIRTNTTLGAYYQLNAMFYTID